MREREAFAVMLWSLATGLRRSDLDDADRAEYLDELEVMVLHAPHGAIRARAVQLLHEHRPVSLVVS